MSRRQQILVGRDRLTIKSRGAVPILLNKSGSIEAPKHDVKPITPHPLNPETIPAVNIEKTVSKTIHKNKEEEKARLAACEALRAAALRPHKKKKMDPRITDVS